jgi:hypothetical protein
MSVTAHNFNPSAAPLRRFRRTVVVAALAWPTATAVALMLQAARRPDAIGGRR